MTATTATTATAATAATPAMPPASAWPLEDSFLWRPMGNLGELVQQHAAHHPQRPALADAQGRLIDFGELDRRVQQAVAALQAEGLCTGDVVALCAANSIEHAVLLIASVSAGLTFAPLPPSATAESLARMLQDCGARVLFVDADGAHAVAGAAGEGAGAHCIALEPDAPGTAYADWAARATQPARLVAPEAAQVFDIIYSSGTTGQPKGIVHTWAMRWPQIRNAALISYRPDSVTLISTPMYSNTTLVSFLPAVGGGGLTVLMKKFNAEVFLALSQQHRATHAMLVPVQYRRLLACASFDDHDLSSYRAKFCTSAPFSAELKAEVLRRWPGGLVEFYGMTEGGGSCMLLAHEHPDKLHTVGQPMADHDIRVIDPDGCELPHGAVGEIVGRSPAMMLGYLNAPQASSAAEWHNAQGERFIRTGDLGRFDAQGFLILMDRSKDLIISGGHNVFPSDIEAVLCTHPAVEEAAVFGVPSEQWGESPVAAVTLRVGGVVGVGGVDNISAPALAAWVNERVSKLQRLQHVLLVEALPRNAIGKVDKRALRAACAVSVTALSSPVSSPPTAPHASSPSPAARPPPSAVHPS